MKSISQFLHFQSTKLTDEYNQILTDDVLLKDGSILRIDSGGYLDGLIECGNGQVEYWKNGLLHGNPAVISADSKHIERWEKGILIAVQDL